MEALFFSKVLQKVPSHWDTMSYNSKVYETVTLSQYGSTRAEYNEIENLFRAEGISSYEVSRIDRVQHPFAYGAFELRKEQLQCRGASTTTVSMIIGESVTN